MVTSQAAMDIWDLSLHSPLTKQHMQYEPSSDCNTQEGV